LNTTSSDLTTTVCYLIRETPVAFVMKFKRHLSELSNESQGSLCVK